MSEKWNRATLTINKPLQPKAVPVKKVRLYRRMAKRKR